MSNTISSLSFPVLRKSLRGRVKEVIDRWPVLKATCLMLMNLQWSFQLLTGKIETESGMAHSGRSLQESIDYIEEVFSDYKKYGDVETFTGRIAEIGPGDNAGVALLMRRDGSGQVDLIDRYLSRYDPEQQSAIYEMLSERHNLNEFRTHDSWDGRELSGVKWRNGESAESYFAANARNSRETYDFIVSRAVMEHLQDPLAVIKDMIKSLRPGGCLLHKIDLRDHGMFSSTHHELTWLNLPAWSWRPMTSHSGLPNRVLIHRYRALLESLKESERIKYSLLVTRLVAVGDITPHKEFNEIDAESRLKAIAFVESKRTEFSAEFRLLDARDVAASGVFLVVNKE